MAGYRDVEIPLARIQGGTAITRPRVRFPTASRTSASLIRRMGHPVRRRHVYGNASGRSSKRPADTHAFTVQAHLPQGGQATLHINKVMPAADSSSETVTQIGQVKASASGADNLATLTHSKTSSSMQRRAFWKKDAKVALCPRLPGQDLYTLLPMAVVTAPAAKAESGSTTIVPTTMDQEIAPFDFPAAFPGIGGNKFTCWMPTFPDPLRFLVCWIRAVWRRIQTSQLYERFGQPLIRNTGRNRRASRAPSRQTATSTKWKGSGISTRV